MMKQRITSKTTVIDGRQYEIKAMTPRDGSWLFTALMAKVTKDGDDRVNLLQISNALQKCSKEEFEQIQREALRYVSRLDENPESGDVFPMPVMDLKGRLVDDKLDAPSVLALTNESIIFNVMPFFQESASNQSPAQAAL
jgi:hypothetical protein